jgi:hypothetical protein
MLIQGALGAHCGARRHRVRGVRPGGHGGVAPSNLVLSKGKRS